MSLQVRAALVGISGYGLSYVEALFNGAHAGRIQLVAAVDPMAEQSRRVEEIRDRRIPIYPSLPAMFKGTQDVELVMLVTPIHLHTPQTCLSLQHGASVLCEKPLAGSLRDARRVAACEQRAGRGKFVAIGYQWSFSQAVQSLKRDIMGGALGKPLGMKAMVSFPRPLSYFKRNDWAGRLRTPAGEDVLDSPVNNATAHYLHNMFYLLGKTRETSAAPATVQAELYRANEIENYDTAALRCLTDAGVPILFYTTHSVADRAGVRSIFEFENATISYDDSASGEFVATFKSGQRKSYGNPNHDRYEKIWQSADAVRTGAPVACGVAAAMSQTLCALAAQQSLPAITAFPRDVIRRVDLGDDSMIAVTGLDEILTRAFDQAALPSELGDVSWARCGRIVDVTELDRAGTQDDAEVALPA